MLPTERLTVFELRHPDTLPPDPPFAREFYEAIGQFMVRWGSMECHLDALARMALNIAEKHTTPAHMHVNLRKKLDQFKSICRDVPELNSFHEEAKNLSQTLKEWGQKRDLFMHSIFIEFDEGPPSRIILRHLEHIKGQNIEVHRFSPTVEDINEFTLQVRNLHRELFSLLEAVSSLQDHEKVEKDLKRDQATGQPRKPIPL